MLHAMEKQSGVYFSQRNYHATCHGETIETLQAMNTTHSILIARVHLFQMSKCNYSNNEMILKIAEFTQ